MSLVIRKLCLILCPTTIRKLIWMCLTFYHLHFISEMEWKIKNIFNFWSTIIRGPSKLPGPIRKREELKSITPGLSSQEKIATEAMASRCVFLYRKSKQFWKREIDIQMAAIALTLCKLISNVHCYIANANSI